MNALRPPQKNSASYKGRALSVALLFAITPTAGFGAEGHSAEADLKTFLPSTISPAARARLTMLRSVRGDDALPKSPEARRAQRAAFEKMAGAFIAPYLKALGATATPIRRGGLDCLEVTPAGYHDDGTLLIYVHGGGFVSFSARSSLLLPSAMAKATGKRVISIDYTLAPEARWPLVTNQVIAVYKAILTSGRPASSIGLFGESAGGDIIASTVLKLRDQGVPLPASLLLISPVTDLTDAGDTRQTLARADPVLSMMSLRIDYDAYADPADQTRPYVSPVYGDFTKPYPAVLIQAGTKELLLSDAVRLNRAIKDAGGRSELDLFEGMPHAFQALLVGSPEGTSAFNAAAAFWRSTLTPWRS